MAITRALLAAVLLLTLGGAARSAVLTCPSELAGRATCYTGQDENGAYYAMAVPTHWNGSLVVFAHGGPDFDVSTPEPWAGMVDAGYAWAASSYRRGGYGVRMAAADTENVRRLFVERFGRPARTYLHGQSYGGDVAAKAAEVYPGSWDGVLLTSGLLAGGSRGYDHRVDLRVVYQYYCRNLPGPEWQGLPEDSTLTPAELHDRLTDCVGSAGARTAVQQRNLDDILAVTRLPERTLEVHLQYATFLFQDIVWKRLGGRNPFSNRGVVYTGSHDDRALNAGVARFDADPTARRDLSYDSDLTGRVAVPVLTLHAIGDPQVLVENEAAYRAPNLVRTFTTETVHSDLSPAEYATSIAALDAWVRTGRKPTPRSIAASCASGCFYDPEFRPPPYPPRPGETPMTAAQERAWSRIAGVGIGF
ncbi:alpha/beta hydrolase family protein [Cryptosporangium phraense]|uniref:Alpha/beta hydrolase n=1 Tax=Cryptosporangium phraense TaxID=2593070 RepID=A0A545AGM6_9ACTN|nr:hypothetical protein [Cryptosporangium phraense]TQS40420.1 hypothetical protein FL583_34825 [Cryptosporangium phraense]